MMYYAYCQGKSFQECFQSLKHCLEINLRPKPLFSGGSDNSCLERERWKTMTVVVEWQRHSPPENVSMVEPLIKKDPKMEYAEM